MKILLHPWWHDEKNLRLNGWRHWLSSVKNSWCRQTSPHVAPAFQLQTRPSRNPWYLIFISQDQRCRNPNRFLCFRKSYCLRKSCLGVINFLFRKHKQIKCKSSENSPWQETDGLSESFGGGVAINTVKGFQKNQINLGLTQYLRAKIRGFGLLAVQQSFCGDEAELKYQD